MSYCRDPWAADPHYDPNSRERLMIMSSCSAAYTPRFRKIEESFIGHTSNPEFEKLSEHQYMEALRDRTVKIDVPFLEHWKKKEEYEKIVKTYAHEHLHVDTDFSLLDGYATQHICKCCGANWAINQWSSGCPGCEEEFVPKIENPCGEIPMPPQYEGHPVGTPPPLPTKCTCDIMALMAQGCKCGWLEIEKNLNAEERKVSADDDFLDQLKKM